MEDDLYFDDVFMKEEEVKESLPFESGIGRKRRHTFFSLDTIKKSKFQNHNVCSAKEEKDKNFFVFHISKSKYCVSRQEIIDMFKEPWITQNAVYNTFIRNREQEKELSERYDNINEHYYYIEKLGFWVTFEFRNQYKNNREFKFVFNSKKNLIRKVGNSVNLLKDILRYDCKIYDAVPLNSSDSMSMLTLAKEMVALNLDEQKNELNDLSDMFLKIKLVNDRYSCDEKKIENRNIFIFENEKSNYFCMTIDEVVIMLENYLVETKTVVDDNGFNLDNFESISNNKKYFKLPFSNIFIDSSIVPLLRNKYNTFVIKKSNKTVNLSSINYNFTNCEVNTIELNGNIILNIRNQDNNKFTGEVFFQKEIERFRGDNIITYRTKKYYMFRNDLPDRLTYDVTNYLKEAEWHQNNSKNKYRNGEFGLPGRVTYFPFKKIKKTEFFDDNSKLHSYDERPSVIAYRNTEDSADDEIEFEEFHNHGKIFLKKFYRKEDGKMKETVWYTKSFNEFGQAMD